MFSPDQVEIEIVEVDETTAIALFRTPIGNGTLCGEFRFAERTLYIDGLHVQAELREQVGRAGINAVVRKLMVETDVAKIVIQGAIRTTGKYAGQIPRPVVFPR